MPRGYVRAVYETDTGEQFQLLVDADAAEDASRGWVVTGASALPQLPRGWLPRRVVGIDESGVQLEARVGLNTAALWVGTVNQWTIIGTDGALHTATVVVRQEERRFPAFRPN